MIVNAAAAVVVGGAPEVVGADVPDVVGEDAPDVAAGVALHADTASNVPVTKSEIAKKRRDRI